MKTLKSGNFENNVLIRKWRAARKRAKWSTLSSDCNWTVNSNKYQSINLGLNFLIFCSLTFKSGYAIHLSLGWWRKKWIDWKATQKGKKPTIKYWFKCRKKARDNNLSRHWFIWTDKESSYLAEVWNGWCNHVYLKPKSIAPYLFIQLMEKPDKNKHNSKFQLSHSIDWSKNMKCFRWKTA